MVVVDETAPLLRAAPRRRAAVLAGALLVLCAGVAGVMSSLHQTRMTEAHDPQLAVFPAYPPNPHPYSPAGNVYMYWGEGAGKRRSESGTAVREIMHMGRLEGGEWRSPKFISALDSRKMGDLIVKCCSALVLPPFAHGWPVWNAEKQRAQHLRDFVANGNNLVVTGGDADLEFINHYFFYHLKPVAGNFDSGPFRQYPKGSLPKQFRKLHGVVHQNGHAVTSVSIRSLPSGTTIVYGSTEGSPVFQIKFCQRVNPRVGEPSIKIRPSECHRGDKKCSCGTITFIGFTFTDFSTDRERIRWSELLRASVGSP
jgi:hypothetical protein